MFLYNLCARVGNCFLFCNSESLISKLRRMISFIWTMTHPGVLEMWSHSHPRRRARRGHRRCVGERVKVSCDQHHVMVNVILQFIRKGKIKHVVWRKNENRVQNGGTISPIWTYLFDNTTLSLMLLLSMIVDIFFLQISIYLIKKSTIFSWCENI